MQVFDVLYGKHIRYEPNSIIKKYISKSITFNNFNIPVQAYN